MKANYAYPLQPDWSTEEIIAATEFYALVEDCYDRGVDRAKFLAAYRRFRQICGAKMIEKQLDREFAAASDLSIFTTARAVQAATSKRVRLPQQKKR